MTIGSEGEADERGGLLDCLENVAAANVDDLYTLLAPAAEQQRDAIAFRRERRRQRHASDYVRLSCRIEIDACRKTDFFRANGDRKRENQDCRCCAELCHASHRFATRATNVFGRGE